MPDTPPPLPKRPASFGIVSVIGCVLLLGFAVVVVLPGFFVGSHASNERNAGASLKTITTAEADFRANDRDGNGAADFWVADVYSLYALCPAGKPVTPVHMIKLIEPSVAAADPARPRAPRIVPIADTYGSWTPKAGYFFDVIPLQEDGSPYDDGTGRHASRFAFCAYPEKYRTGGGWLSRTRDVTRHTFVVNQDCTIWRRDAGGAPMRQWLPAPATGGWIKLD